MSEKYQRSYGQYFKNLVNCKQCCGPPFKEDARHNSLETGAEFPDDRSVLQLPYSCHVYCYNRLMMALTKAEVEMI